MVKILSIEDLTLKATQKHSYRVCYVDTATPEKFFKEFSDLVEYLKEDKSISLIYKIIDPHGNDLTNLVKLVSESIMVAFFNFFKTKIEYYLYPVSIIERPEGGYVIKYSVMKEKSKLLNFKSYWLIERETIVVSHLTPEFKQTKSLLRMGQLPIKLKTGSFRQYLIENGVSIYEDG